VLSEIYANSRKPVAVVPETAPSPTVLNEPPKDHSAFVTSPSSLDVQSATAKLVEKELKLVANEKEPWPEYHSVQFASNNPVEDQYVYGVASGVSMAPWCFWGVFDGHAYV
jgi:hypothetical protein